jgi:monodehydroascorbate reductase (NADH)
MKLISFAVGRLFTPKIAEYYENYYTSKGVTFVKGTVLTSFEKDTTGKVSFHNSIP